MLALFWDIDGTLLTTGKAGMYAWEEAAEEVLGRPADLHGIKTSGFTDRQVAFEILRFLGEPAAADQAERMVGLYESRLPAALPRRQGRVLRNVKEILQASRGRKDVLTLLLTGNTRLGAKAKLSYYGLDAFFDGGAFSDDGHDRPGIARAALELAQGRADGRLDPARAVVIGDTPHDIHCGKAVGARTLAVASGDYALDALQGHAPWKALQELPEPGAFFRLVEAV